MTEPANTQPTQTQPPKKQEAEKQKSLTYPEIASRLFTLLVARSGSHQDAKQALNHWFSTLTPAEQEEFKNDKEVFQNTLKRFEGAVDTIRQESQYILYR